MNLTPDPEVVAGRRIPNGGWAIAINKKSVFRGWEVSDERPSYAAAYMERALRGLMRSIEKIDGMGLNIDLTASGSLLEVVETYLT